MPLTKADPQARRRANASPEADHKDVREPIFRSYRIIYRTKPGRVQVITVFHGSRDLAAKEVKPWDVGKQQAPLQRGLGEAFTVGQILIPPSRVGNCDPMTIAHGPCEIHQCRASIYLRRLTPCAPQLF
jgi:hypothetical protein